MSVARDGDGFALQLYVGEWHWRPENRFCPRGSCTATPSTSCQACPVPEMTPERRALNIAMVRLGKTSASDPGTP